MVSTSPPPKQQEALSDNKWKEEADNTRRAKWWYSTFHTVTAMIGAGVLSLPYAMAYLGWGPGTMVLAVSWCMTLNTMWQMIQLHECVPGVRFDRYIDLGRHAFGPKLGPWIVLPQQLIVQIGCDIVYMVTGGKCLKQFMEMACSSCTPIKQSYWILMFGSIHFFLSQLPNFNSVAGVSLAAAIMSLSYSTIAWAGCLSKGAVDNVSYAYKKTSSVDYMFRVFNSLGQISFAFAGHAVALEIQATMPSTPERPSRIPMWKGAVGAYIINAICYFPVALIGYWAFGQDVADNVLVDLKRPTWLIASANLMVVVHVIGSYQVFAMPVFDLLERTMMKKLNFPPGVALRLVARSAYVAFTLFVGVTFPFFGDLLGFFGGFGFAPTSYFLPSIMWLAIKKPKRFSTNWFVNWASIFVGVFIMLASTIGGLRNIVTDASTYRFYTWWKDLDFANKLPFARDRIVETYFWALATIFEPEYQFARTMVCKYGALTTVQDDVYDVYGSYQELELYTDAIERWDISAIDDQLPQCLKDCYKGLLDSYSAYEEKLAKEGNLYRLDYAKEAIKIQLRGYFQEAKWLKEKYTPTMDEYIPNGLNSSFYPMAITSFVGMGGLVTKDTMDWVLNDPKIVKATALTGRLLNDMAGHKFEQDIEQGASSVECYMNQYGVTEEEAKIELTKQKDDAWKDINQEWLDLHSSNGIPKPLLQIILNLARSGEVLYKNEDLYTNAEAGLKGFIVSLLIEPVPI